METTVFIAYLKLVPEEKGFMIGLVVKLPYSSIGSN
ncbi:uncharacterized protein G2W53_036016 [Senna tora]|uniref:Uncharacterized protein n=1 Tax=Senna tora TaxID=362788 RepID=A0A834SRQ4_9FABA|nr:uncharacterized protein G2W53_036016 [Senna tora]